MIELKITVDKAVELEQEVKELYEVFKAGQRLPVAAPNKKDSSVKKEAPKVEVTRDEPVEKDIPKVEAPKKEPVEEPAKKEVPSLEATREAVKDVMAKATDKTKAKGEFKAFLDSIGAEKVTSATDEQRIQIMEWVNSRG